MHLPDLRQRVFAEAAREAAELRTVATTEITPSRRDFVMFVSTQRRGIAIVPRFRRLGPLAGGAGADADAAAVARRWDDAEAPAIAVSTSAVYGGSRQDLRVISDAVSAPVFCEDPCLTDQQVYLARLHGADAVLLPAGHLEPVALAALVKLAASMHMAAIVEVAGTGELAATERVAPACVAISAPRPDGRLDVEAAVALAKRLTSRRTVLLLDEIESTSELAPLEGLVDASVCGAPAFAAPDEAALAALFASGQ